MTIFAKKMMIKLYLLVCVVLLFMACKKNMEPAGVLPPEMTYKNLHDSAVFFGQAASFDLDGDGTKDIRFLTQLVGDPIAMQDKKQWLVLSSFTTNLPVNNDENIPVLNLSDSIPVNDFSGYFWYNASEIVLAQKIITNTGHFWDGQWKDVTHRFLPVQMVKDSARQNGWVEVSFSTTEEKIILHRAALCITFDKAIKAGK